MASGVPKITYI